MRWLVAVAALGCGEDPEPPPSLSTYTGVYEVTSYRIDLEMCSEGAEEPWTAPYFEVALAAGALEIRPCDAPSDCGLANQLEWLFTDSEEAAALGTATSSDLDDGLCTLIWGEMQMTRSGDEVVLTRETWFNDEDVPGTSIADCDVAVPGYTGDRVCVARRVLEGRAVQ